MPAVKRRVGPTPRSASGCGSRRGRVEARRPATSWRRSRALLAEQGLYVFTINGFPYGAFHGSPVKEHVYLPDWLEDERLVYTDRLAELLAALLPRRRRGHA